MVGSKTGLGAILALDVGLRRIGIAVSDDLGITAQGLRTLERKNRAYDLDYLRNLAAERKARLWLVGLPRNMRGDEGRQAELVRRFGDAVGIHSRLPVQYWDERLTTVEAERVLRSADSSRDRTRRAIDKLSAVILLQSFLDAQL